ncbi:MAG: 3-dehydroquinate synthase [Selenomonadaceae bacterium]|nr:3-dehydroquinate synthase [Selenomonadaceae bacterium]
MKTIRVELGANSYDIFIGNHLDDQIGQFLSTQKFSKKALLVTDTNVGAIVGDRIEKAIGNAGFDVKVVTVDAGEISKSLAVAENIFTAAIEHKLDRKSMIIALGGGVVGDLTGFVAATFMRGVPFIQIPTSLLAQVDSSVGGKVAVNHALGKNLIGAFYQPRAVFIDLDFLSTLPTREIASGLGEIVKYGVIADADFFCTLESHVDQILALDNLTLEKIIARSCEIKADVVSKDEKEGGLRRILNFGHTIAHAVEEETHYKKYRHGEAVAIGMIGAAHISRELERISDADVERLQRLIDRLKMISRVEGIDVEQTYNALFRDKKTVDGKINWVVMDSIGCVSIVNDVPESVVKSALKKIIA